MRLLILAAQYFPVVGGSEVQSRLLARELKKRGHHVEVWTRRIDPDHAVRELLDEVPVRRLGATFTSRAPWVRRVERLDFVLRLYREMRLKLRDFDLVLANQLQYPAVVAVIARRGIRVPVVARCAASGPESSMHRKEWLFRLQRRFLTRDLDSVIALGPVTRDDCEAAGFKPARLVVIPNGIDEPQEGQRLRDQASPLRVVWLGKFRQEKRADLAVSAWHEAAIQGTLILVGDGEDRAAIEAQVGLGRDRGLAPVELKGLLNAPQSELARAHVFLQSSDTEGLSNALLEAMAAGCACVATDVGETRFVLGGEGKIEEGSFLRAEAGLLVRAGDVKGVALALGALVDPTLREALGEAAAKRCRDNHQIGRLAERYEELFRGLVNDTHGSSEARVEPGG